MSVWFSDDCSPTAVDETHPVDVLEPQDMPVDRGLTDTLTLTERIAASYVSGDPAITRIAWRVLLNQEPESIRACARRTGCTAAAISRRVKILAEDFGLPLTRPQVRAMRSWITRESWKARRREASQPPAAANERTEVNNPQVKKGGHS